MTIQALILAAGFSTRMAPHFKPLLPLSFPSEECSALQAVCACYQAEGIRPLVIGGNRAQETAAAARGCGAAFACNPHPENGMFSSIQAGLAALPPETAAFFVHPVDIPLVRRMTIRALLEVQAADSSTVLIPTFQGEEGHPPLLPGSLRERLLAHDGQGGLRAALKDAPRRPVPVADSFILRDMDSPADYAALQTAAMRHDTLSLPEAEELLQVRAVPQQIQAHCRAVSAVAAALATALNSVRRQPGARTLDVSLAQVGGLLHDVCKGQRRHETAAGVLFRSWGMVRMARLVEDHRDMDLPADGILTERELIFLADKYVSGTQAVSLELRFQQKRDIFAERPDICAEIDGRQKRARRMADCFERESGMDPAQIALHVMEGLSLPTNNRKGMCASHLTRNDHTG